MACVFRNVSGNFLGNKLLARVLFEGYPHVPFDTFQDQTPLFSSRAVSNLIISLQENGTERN